LLVGSVVGGCSKRLALNTGEPVAHGTRRELLIGGVIGGET
jgi:hypothetical protein